MLEYLIIVIKFVMGGMELELQDALSIYLPGGPK